MANGIRLLRLNGKKILKSSYAPHSIITVETVYHIKRSKFYIVASSSTIGSTHQTYSSFFICIFDIFLHFLCRKVK